MVRTYCKPHKAHSCGEEPQATPKGESPVMMAKSDYSEDKMIQEDAAIILGDELGWTSINAFQETEAAPTLRAQQLHRGGVESRCAGRA